MSIKDKLHITSQDKTHETDLQMFKRISLRFLALFTVILFFDSLIEGFFAGFDLLTEFLHIGVEFVEYSLELFLEYSFGTGHHISEIIIVNSTLVLIIYLLYRLIRYLPTLFKKIIHYFATLYSKWMNYEYTCWHTLTLSRKVKVITVYSFYLTILSFLITL